MAFPSHSLPRDEALAQINEAVHKPAARLRTRGFSGSRRHGDGRRRSEAPFSQEEIRIDTVARQKQSLHAPATGSDFD